MAYFQKKKKKLIQKNFQKKKSENLFLNSIYFSRKGERMKKRGLEECSDD